MIECIEQTGKALNLNNEGIVKYLCGIEEERKNLEIIIQKQYQERKRVEAEIERLTYKLCLVSDFKEFVKINKSLSMRIKAKNNYDKTIEEIKGHYERLVDSSNKLRQIVEKTQQELDDIMNKKTGTGPEGGAVTMLYVKPDGDLCQESCPCSYTPETPTKEKSPTQLPKASTTPPSSNGDFEQKTSVDTSSGVDDSSHVNAVGPTKSGISTASSMRSKPGSTGPPPEISFKYNTGSIMPKNLSVDGQKSRSSPKGSNISGVDEESSKNLLLSRLRSIDKTTIVRQLPVNSNETVSKTEPGTQKSTEELSENTEEVSQIL